MMIELLCRYPKEISKEDLKYIDEELNIQSVIKGDKFDELSEREKLLKQNGKMKYDYGLFTLNIKDVAYFNLADEEHTCLRMHGGQAFTFKIPYEEFRAVFQTFTGQIINDFSNITLIRDDRKDKSNKNG